MEHPYLTIQRICEEQKIDRGELIYPLLALLMGNHVMQSARGAGMNFVTEVMERKTSYARLYGMPEEEALSLPPSVLSALETMLRMQWELDDHNANNPEVQYQKEEHRDQAKRHAIAGKTLLLIMREMMNQADAQGIRVQLDIESRHGKQPPQK